MNEQWREKLFELPKDEFTLNPLGFAFSRSHGTEILGICYRTWQRWEQIAMLIPEYKFERLRLDREAAKHDANSVVIPYMVWCVALVGELHSKLPHGTKKRWMVEAYIKKQGEIFTRKAYQEEQTRYTSMVLTA